MGASSRRNGVLRKGDTGHRCGGSCEHAAETGTRLPRPPGPSTAPRAGGPDGSPSVNPPRPWGQTSGVHAGQRSRVPGSPRRRCRPRCRLSLADVGSLLGGGLCAFAGKSHKTSFPPATSYANRPALHRMRSTVPGVASPGPPALPVPAQRGPSCPASIHLAPPRSRRCPMATLSLARALPSPPGPLAAPGARGQRPSRAHPAPRALAPLAVPAPRVLLLYPKPQPPLTRQITTQSISPLVPWEGSLYLCAPSCSPVSPKSPEQCLPRRGRLSRVFGGIEQLRE